MEVEEAVVHGWEAAAAEEEAGVVGGVVRYGVVWRHAACLWPAICH